MTLGSRARRREIAPVARRIGRAGSAVRRRFMASDVRSERNPMPDAAVSEHGRRVVSCCVGSRCTSASCGRTEISSFGSKRHWRRPTPCPRCQPGQFPANLLVGCIEPAISWYVGARQVCARVARGNRRWRRWAEGWCELGVHNVPRRTSTFPQPQRSPLAAYAIFLRLRESGAFSEGFCRKDLHGS